MRQMNSISERGRFPDWPRRAPKYIAISGSFIILHAALAFGQSAKETAVCEGLAKLALPEATITRAEAFAPREYVLPGSSGGSEKAAHGMPTPFHPADTTNHVPFCRVAATLKPSGDSDIKIEVWLPLSGWNGKLLGLGNFGWAGNIMYGGLLIGLEGGYVSVSTDTGHDQSQGFGEFALGHPDKTIDYGYRAVHEMTLKAKALVKAFYGTAPSHSYWTGCSLGGQQGLIEAERFPEDYDGVIVGSPANPITNLNAAQIWPSLLINEDPSQYIPPMKYAMIHEAVLKACDEADGVRDGVIEDPTSCHFDPGILQCKREDNASCLTAPQVDFMRKLYAGPIDPRTGEKIYEPPARGSELSLPAFTGKNAMGVAVALFQYMVYQDPRWDWRTLNLDSGVAFGDKVLSTINLAANANLKPFFDRGGKLLMYHGWTDFSSPLESVDYYNAVRASVGTAEAANSIRLFAMPGMDHCMGGGGCDTFNKVAVIDRWVETGKAPERIVASKLSGDKTIRTHPLCAYPEVAKYSGTGDVNEAENFSCSK